MAILNDFLVLKGETIYTPLMGYIEVEDVLLTSGIVTLIISKDASQRAISINENGKWCGFEEGECIIFPSKECRDWSMFKRGLKRGTPCMVSTTLGPIPKADSWQLSWYYGRNGDGSKHLCGTQDIDNSTAKSWNHIIPVDKFNFEDPLKQDNNYNYGCCYVS